MGIFGALLTFFINTALMFTVARAQDFDAQYGDAMDANNCL